MRRTLRGAFAAVVLGMAAALLTGAPSAQASSISASTQHEIDQLLERLERSGCRFQRNGEWHDAAEARAHLQRKFDYLIKRGRVGTTEDFIAGAATRSSLSGRAYAVQCGAEPELPSAEWLGQELDRIRKAASP